MKAGKLVRSYVLVSLVAGCSNDVELNDGSEAVLRAHLAPDAKCKLDADSEVVAKGTYDVSPGGADGSTSCDEPYDLNLLVENVVPQTVVYDEAEIEIMNVDEANIRFDRDKKAILPNPFVSHVAAPVGGRSTGVVTVEAIPLRYAHQLDTFAGEELLVKVVLRGKTKSGDAVRSRALNYPVALCDGCLTMCLQQDVLDSELDLDTVLGDQCADNAGADDRLCIDPDC